MHFSISTSHVCSASHEPVKFRSCCIAFVHPEFQRSSKSIPADNAIFPRSPGFGESVCIRPSPIKRSSNLFSAGAKNSCSHMVFLNLAASVVKRERQQPLVIVCREKAIFRRRPKSITLEAADYSVEKNKLSICYFNIISDSRPRVSVISVIAGFRQSKDRISKDHGKAAAHSREGEYER